MKNARAERNGRFALKTCDRRNRPLLMPPGTNTSADIASSSADRRAPRVRPALPRVPRLRSGAGLVTVAATGDAVPSLGAALTAVMVREVEDGAALATLLRDDAPECCRRWARERRWTGDKGTRRGGAGSSASVVLDADALIQLRRRYSAPLQAVERTRRADAPRRRIRDGCFRAFFQPLANRIEAARTAALRSGATVLLKGPDTIVANPSGDVAVNTNAPPATCDCRLRRCTCRDHRRFDGAGHAGVRRSAHRRIPAWSMRQNCWIRIDRGRPRGSPSAKRSRR